LSRLRFCLSGRTVGSCAGPLIPLKIEQLVHVMGNLIRDIAYHLHPGLSQPSRGAQTGAVCGRSVVHDDARGGLTAVHCRAVSGALFLATIHGDCRVETREGALALAPGEN
jgi:hypothetical protein